MRPILSLLYVSTVIVITGCGPTVSNYEPQRTPRKLNPPSVKLYQAIEPAVIPLIQSLNNAANTVKIRKLTASEKNEIVKTASHLQKPNLPEDVYSKQSTEVFRITGKSWEFATPKVYPKITSAKVWLLSNTETQWDEKDSLNFAGDGQSRLEIKPELSQAQIVQYDESVDIQSVEPTFVATQEMLVNFHPLRLQTKKSNPVYALQVEYLTLDEQTEKIYADLQMTLKDAVTSLEKPEVSLFDLVRVRDSLRDVMDNLKQPLK